MEIEIRAQYFSREDVEISSDKLFSLIHANRPIELLDFLQTIPRDQCPELLNRKNEHFHNFNPLGYALRCSAHHLVIIALLRAGAIYADTAESPLFQAVREGLMNLVKILVVTGANVNVLDSGGFSLVHWACFRGNTLMARLLLKMTDFSFFNHDRNERVISPLGIAVEMGNSELARELLSCPEMDPNIIDTKTGRYLYDLAAERGLYRICYEMECAFVRNFGGEQEGRLSKKRINSLFHDLHEYKVEFLLHEQIRSLWGWFVDDPRGAYSPLDAPSLKLKTVPEAKNWLVLEEAGNFDGWTQSFLKDAKTGQAAAVSLDFRKIVNGGLLFECIDNHRYRTLIRCKRAKNEFSHK